MSWTKSHEARIGKRLPEETRRKISESLMGKIPWNKGKKGVQHQSEETRKKISKAVKGRIFSEEHKQKISKALTGKTKRNLHWIGRRHTEESKKKNSISHIGLNVGKKNGNWQGGITPINIKIKISKKYQDWRKKVFERDDYTCQICEQRGYKLEVHHIKSFSKYPKRRFWVSNGITLCKNCHQIITTYLKKGEKRGKYKKIKLEEVV